MDRLPLWLVFVVSAMIIIASTEVGFLLGRRQHTRGAETQKITTGPIVAASLGLLAFMLAFTFGAVMSRFDDRKQLVLEEANAIGTAFLRADALPEQARDRIQRILYDYITLRIDATQSKDAENIMQAVIKSEQMQKEMWSLAMSIAQREPTPVSALLLQSLNQLIDLQQKRITVSAYHRMPTVFWFALYGLVILAMAVGGYDTGLPGGERSTTARLIVAVAFSLVLLLIVALERPVVALTSVNQAALIDVQRSIKASLPQS